MNFNPETHLAAVERSVTFLERDGQPPAQLPFPAASTPLWRTCGMQ